jgi:hypothetical protein
VHRRSNSANSGKVHSNREHKKAAQEEYLCRLPQAADADFLSAAEHGALPESSLAKKATDNFRAG